MFCKRCSLIMTAMIILMSMISGCATPRPAKSTPAIVPPQTEFASSTGWWQARYRIHWPPEEPVEWHWDLLIADKIVAPVLSQYKSDIHLWRFHRRAARDDTGHQFSFIFFASAETAYQVFAALGTNDLLAKMKSAGVIEEDRYDNPAQNNRPQIEDTSDPGWPLSIQRSWPYFMMGASQMWLDLISETVDKMPILYNPLSLQENEQQYKKVDASIGKHWENYGRHAFLHHLSGLFGYRAISFYEKRMLQF